MPDAPLPFVLVVTDDPALVAQTTPLFARAGLDAEAVEIGRGALRTLDARRPALVAFDADPADDDTLGDLEALHEAHPEVPVIAFVDDLPPERAADVLHAGAAHLLQKPVHPDRLLARVAAVLDAAGRAGRARTQFDDHVGRARVALGERRVAAAEAHARAALGCDGTRPEPFNVLGIVAQLRMDLPAAQRLYRAALALDDRFEPARRNLIALSAFPKKLSAFEA